MTDKQYEDMRPRLVIDLRVVVNKGDNPIVMQPARLVTLDGLEPGQEVTAQEESEPDQDEITRIYKELVGMRIMLEKQGDEIRALQTSGIRN